jgi:micrococcal nuclease
MLAAGGLLLAILAGCSSATTPSVTVGPTAQSAATSVAPTARAIGTEAAPTVRALATDAAPVAATVTAAAPVRVTNVNVAIGDSTVTVQDVGSQPVNLSNWSLQVGTARAQLPSGVDIQPGRTVTLHTMSGSSTQTDVYLGQDAQAITNELRPGTQVTLENPSGMPISSFVVPNA